MHSFAYGAGAFAVYAVAALGVLRLPGRAPPGARLAGTALLVHLGTTAAAACCPWPLSYWHGAALYWCCFVFALFGYCAVYKSVSLGILVLLARQGRDGLSLDRIAEAHVWPGFLSRA